MLHILMSSPFKTNIDYIVKFLNDFDDFLALQNGVLIALKNNVFLRHFKKKKVTLFVLQEDIIARGLEYQVSKIFHIINYTQFVTLTVKNKHQMKW
ncbi:sulfurtransferase complex subunit TusB [Buchnera aphidicola (Thelaxes californica)]|uniref:Sulfurtransferase complex subunit TusB n=1 Tax=Buchnera aphidicola (Thelaxes californica) TaxID=1315998 RepID=A0A4D6YJY5_9GAMM|nr:sulfurtransferase complex subunit TusB [Buchnera aphidicola]QCI26931.1 sulfurtransferase complex subunit TusB [Buchnera aphidicola (Thelaxes californica)]